MPDDFDQIAGKAAARLSEQNSQLLAAEAQIDDLHRALRDTEAVAKDATEALEKEQSRRQSAEDALFGAGRDSGRMRNRSMSQPEAASDIG